MKNEIYVKKIVDEINNFLLYSNKGTKELKFGDEVILSPDEVEEFSNEIIIDLLRPTADTKFGIYEREIPGFYIVEYIIKTGKPVYFIHLFFLKQGGKYKLHLVAMSRFFEF